MTEKTNSNVSDEEPSSQLRKRKKKFKLAKSFFYIFPLTDVRLPSLCFFLYYLCFLDSCHNTNSLKSTERLQDQDNFVLALPFLGTHSKRRCSYPFLLSRDNACLRLKNKTKYLGETGSGSGTNDNMLIKP